ncbi:MAG: LPS export ABC transporter periplasmic protein LptC [Flavobacteriales bacterium]|nr:LPS export ABC transporter periplasmic protein LptC [Flavobacteriales bacterium]MBV6463283.1 hypothetical protein [Chlorobiota bacterium]
MECRTIGYALSIAATMVLLTSCSQHQQYKRSDNDPYLMAPLHVSYNIQVRFQDSSFTKAVLQAGKAQVYETRMETLLGQGIRIVFYEKNSVKEVATLVADSAVIDDRTKNMTAIGNVVVHSDSSNTTLKTATLNWDQGDEKIKTSDAVRITTPTEEIDGIGFVSDHMLINYTIFRVRGVHRR